MHSLSNTCETLLLSNSNIKGYQNNDNPDVLYLYWPGTGRGKTIVTTSRIAKNSWCWEQNEEKIGELEEWFLSNTTPLSEEECYAALIKYL